MTIATTYKDPFSKLVLFGSLLFIVGIVFSKFLLSVSMIGLTILAIAIAVKNKVRWEGDFISFACVMLIFLSTLISGINSEDTNQWIGFLRKKLPFLILPLTFYVLKDHFSRNYHLLIAAFVWVISLSTLFVLGNYLSNYQEINELISKGQSIPTPVDHIKYSIFVAFACIGSFVLFAQKRFFISKQEPLAYLLHAIALFVFVHILAVRSGIAVLYGSIALLGFYYLIKFKKQKWTLLFLVAIIALPYLAYKTIPSLHRKVSYMMYDLNKYRSGEGVNYSDSERLYSYKVGWQLFQENKLIGVGIADLKNECNKRYKEDLNIVLDKYPHNQYLFTLAGMGIIGLILLLISIFYPLFHFRNNWEAVFLALNCIILLSFLVENTIERSYSAGFYLFFMLSAMCYMSKE